MSPCWLVEINGGGGYKGKSVRDESCHVLNLAKKHLNSWFCWIHSFAVVPLHVRPVLSHCVASCRGQSPITTATHPKEEVGNQHSHFRWALMTAGSMQGLSSWWPRPSWSRHAPLPRLASCKPLLMSALRVAGKSRWLFHLRGDRFQQWLWRSNHRSWCAARAHIMSQT